MSNLRQQLKVLESLPAFNHTERIVMIEIIRELIRRIGDLEDRLDNKEAYGPTMKREE